MAVMIAPLTQPAEISSSGHILLLKLFWFAPRLAAAEFSFSEAFNSCCHEVLPPTIPQSHMKAMRSDVGQVELAWGKYQQHASDRFPTCTDRSSLWLCYIAKTPCQGEIRSSCRHLNIPRFNMLDFLGCKSMISSYLEALQLTIADHFIDRVAMTLPAGSEFVYSEWGHTWLWNCIAVFDCMHLISLDWTQAYCQLEEWEKVGRKRW